MNIVIPFLMWYIENIHHITRVTHNMTNAMIFGGML